MAGLVPAQHPPFGELLCVRVVGTPFFDLRKSKKASCKRWITAVKALKDWKWESGHKPLQLIKNKLEILCFKEAFPNRG